MSESVVFVYNEFSEMFPELSTTESQAEYAFSFAEDIVNNTLQAYVIEVCKRKRILYLLTAHIVFLTNRGAGNIGSVASAHEGSVSVSYSKGALDNGSYLSQTQYGILLQSLLAKYLSGFYVD